MGKYRKIWENMGNILYMGNIWEECGKLEEPMGYAQDMNGDNDD